MRFCILIARVLMQHLAYHRRILIAVLPVIIFIIAKHLLVRSFLVLANNISSISLLSCFRFLRLLLHIFISQMEEERERERERATNKVILTDRMSDVGKHGYRDSGASIVFENIRVQLQQLIDRCTKRVTDIMPEKVHEYSFCPTGKTNASCTRSSSVISRNKWILRHTHDRRCKI